MSNISGINSYILNSYRNAPGSNTADSRASNASDILRKTAVRKTGDPKAQQKTPDSYALVRNKARTSAIEKEAADSAAALRTSALELAGGKVLSPDENGEYDRKAVTESIKQFADNYNKTISAVKRSDSEEAIRKNSSMLGSTAAFRNSLSNIGVNVNDDDSISVDEEKLGSADIRNVKTLFAGNYSYASRIADKADAIAQTERSEIGGAYDRSGDMGSYTNAMVETLLSAEA
ncbi:MAG: hypothetical protein K6C13_00945 [Oscillospiraceae bacterium]|nr:hypothetical protein [Oscillospiraceae bacterium]